MQLRYLAIEGNIGSGKTTLAQKLAVHLNAKTVLEEFADNPFLPRFYKDPERYAFPLELSFLADRYQQLKENFSSTELFEQCLITDYLFLKSKLFSRLNHPLEEYDLFTRLYVVMELRLPKPNLLLYLYAPTNVLQQRIKSRGRPYELHIKDEYLREVEALYQQQLKRMDCPVLIADSSTLDFENDENHFQLLKDAILEDRSESVRWLRL